MPTFDCPFPDCETFVTEAQRYDHLIADHNGEACTDADCNEILFEATKKSHKARFHQARATIKGVFGKKSYERKFTLNRDPITREFHCPSVGCGKALAVPTNIQRHITGTHGEGKKCGIPRNIMTRVRKPGEEINDDSSDEEVSEEEEEEAQQNDNEEVQQNEDDEEMRPDEAVERQVDDAMDFEPTGGLEDGEADAGDEGPILEEHDVFKTMGFHILKPFQVLVCLDCQYAVRPGHAISHSRSRALHTRKRRLPDKTTFEEAISVLRDAGKPHYKPRRAVKPVPGLRVRDGLICEKCRYMTGNETYMKQHFSIMHKGFDRESNTRWGKMQRFYDKADKQGEDVHWEVLEVDTTPAATTAVGKYIEERQKEAAEKRKNGPVVIRGPETDRDLNYFLYKTRYLQVVKEADPQFLYAMARKPTEEEAWLFPLVQSVREYVLEFAFEHLEKMDLSTRRRLNTLKGELNNDPFKRRQEKSSVIAVADLLCRVICIIMRSNRMAFPNFEIPLTAAQDDQAGELYEALEDEEEHAHLIHPFVLSLFTSTPDDEEENSEPLYCALSRCILMTTLCEDGRFDRPNNISSILAGHQYWMRLAAAYEINQQARGRVSRQLKVYEDQFQQFLTDGMPTPFSTNCVFIRLVAGIVMGGMGFGTIGWGPANKYVTLDGSVLVIEKYKIGVRAIVDEIEEFFYERVLRKIRFEELEAILDKMLDPQDLEHHLKDNPRNMSMGYSFLFDKENGFEKFEFALLEAFMDHKNKSKDIDFFTLNADGTVLWKPDAVLSWFTDDAYFNKLLASGIHLNVPGVSRGTEISSMLLTNTLGGDRGLHVINGLLTILVTYVKQQSMGNPIGFVTKHACHRLTYITVYYLVIARSLARIWAPQMFSEVEVETYTSHVFVLYGKVITSQQLSKSILELTQTHIGFGFGIAQHRQFLTAVMMNEGYDLRKLADMNEDADPKDVIHEMNNHSKRVGQRIYGGSLDGFSQILAINAARQEDVSRAHHNWLGLGDRRGLAPGQTPYGFLFGEAQVETTAAKYIVGEMKSLHERSTKAAVTEAMVDITPNLQHALVASMIEGSRPVVSKEESTSPLVIVHPRRLLALRAVLHDPTANWKCIEQGQMAQLMCRRKEHGLVILPTGGGKSVAATLMSQEERTGFTLLCVPFRSLYEDYKLRLHKSGIPWTKYPIRDRAAFEQARIVLVMVDWFQDPEFIIWLKGWADFGLHRIIVDEAWVMFTQDHFRYACECIRNANIVGTQFLFLSATWPIGLEYLLWERFGFDRKLTRVIRAGSTARLEISIQVKKVDEDEVEGAVLEFLDNVEPLKSNERGIIFCTTIADAERYAELLDIPCYHGQMTEKEKTRVFANWIAGEDEDGVSCQVVSATGAMGQGVDFPGVRYVVHVQPPYTLTDYVQQMGRAGRDGKPAISILIHSRPPFATTTQNGIDFGGNKAMTDYVTLRPICWRSPISRFFDLLQLTCSTLAGAQLCEICQEKLKDSDPPALTPLALPYPTPVSAPHGKGKGRQDSHVDELSRPSSPIQPQHPTRPSMPNRKGKGRREPEFDEYHPPSSPIRIHGDTPRKRRFEECERYDSYQPFDDLQDVHEQEEIQPPPPKARRVSGDGVSGRSVRPATMTVERSPAPQRAPQPQASGSRTAPARRESTASAASSTTTSSRRRGYQRYTGRDIPVYKDQPSSLTLERFKPRLPRELPQAQAPEPAPPRPRNPAPPPHAASATAGPSTSHNRRLPRALPGDAPTIQSVAAGHAAKNTEKFFRGTQVKKLLEDFMQFRSLKRGCVFEYYNSVGNREDFVPQTRENSNPKHPSMYCASGLYAKNESEYSNTFKNGMPSSGAFYCWACGVPAEQPFGHPKRNAEEVKRLTRGCGETEDVVKELVYLIWFNNQKVFDDVVSPLLDDWMTCGDLRDLGSFKKWVFAKPEDDTKWMNSIEMLYHYGKWRGICQ